MTNEWLGLSKLFFEKLILSCKIFAVTSSSSDDASYQNVAKRLEPKRNSRRSYNRTLDCICQISLCAGFAKQNFARFFTDLNISVAGKAVFIIADIEYIATKALQILQRVGRRADLVLQ